MLATGLSVALLRSIFPDKSTEWLLLVNKAKVFLQRAATDAACVEGEQHNMDVQYILDVTNSMFETLRKDNPQLATIS